MPGADSTPPLPQLIAELRILIIEYLRQETVVPLKQLGKYVSYGLLGSALLGFGVVFVAVGILRLLQTETGSTFTGNWSWAPYAILVVVLGLGAALTWQVLGVARRRKGAR